MAALQPGSIAVLENLRFHKGEEKNDPEFAAALAKLGDIFVSDAFSTAHRAHASTDAVTRLLPSYAGPLMMEEINALRSVLDKPKRPVAAVVGGAKVSTKIPVLTNLAAKVDKLIIGGGMANTFLLAQGVRIGRSLAEPDLLDTAREIMHAAKARSCEIVLPADVVIAAKFEAGAPSRVCPVLETPADQMILDVGPKAVAHYIDVLSRCSTLLWNGPLGAFEIEPFGEGTFKLARAAAEATAGRQAHLGCRRRRHGRSPQCGGGHAAVQLRLDGWRRVPRVARGPGIAGHSRADRGRKVVGILQIADLSECRSTRSGRLTA